MGLKVDIVRQILMIVLAIYVKMEEHVWILLISTVVCVLRLLPANIAQLVRLCSCGVYPDSSTRMFL